MFSDCVHSVFQWTDGSSTHYVGISHFNRANFIILFAAWKKSKLISAGPRDRMKALTSYRCQMRHRLRPHSTQLQKKINFLISHAWIESDWWCWWGKERQGEIQPATHTTQKNLLFSTEIMLSMFFNLRLRFDMDIRHWYQCNCVKLHVIKLRHWSVSIARHPKHTKTMHMMILSKASKDQMDKMRNTYDSVFDFIGFQRKEKRPRERDQHIAVEFRCLSLSLSLSLALFLCAATCDQTARWASFRLTWHVRMCVSHSNIEMIFRSTEQQVNNWASGTQCIYVNRDVRTRAASIMMEDGRENRFRL